MGGIFRNRSEASPPYSRSRGQRFPQLRVRRDSGQYPRRGCCPKTKWPQHPRTNDHGQRSAKPRHGRLACGWRIHKITRQLGLVQSATVLLPPIRVKLSGVAGPPRPGSGSRPSNPVRRTDLTCLPGRRFGSAKIFSLSRSMWTTPLDAADAVPRLACPLSVLLNSLSFQEKKCEVG